MLIGDQEVVNELFAPLNNAFDNMERQHSERVQDIEAFIEQLEVALLVLSAQLLHALLHKLLVLLVCLLQHFFEFLDLGDAALSGNDGPDCVLDWSSLVLKILDLLHDDGRVLLWLQAVDAVQEHGSVVVGDQVGLPGGEQLVLEVVHHVVLDRGVTGHAVLHLAQVDLRLVGELGLALGLELLVLFPHHAVVLLLLVQNTSREDLALGLEAGGHGRHSSVLRLPTWPESSWLDVGPGVRHFVSVV